MGLNAFKSALILRATEAFKRVRQALSQPIHVDSGQYRIIGILAGILSLVLLIVVLPLTISTAETYGELESTMMRIQKARTVMGQKDALKAQKDEITQVYRADGAYLPSEASAIASASLQSRIKQILMESDAELASLQVLPDRKEDQFDRVGIKVRFNSDTKALRHVLYNIETNQPYLFVDYLSVRAIRGASGSKSQVDAEQLTVEVDVLGYMRPQ